MKKGFVLFTELMNKYIFLVRELVFWAVLGTRYFLITVTLKDGELFWRLQVLCMCPDTCQMKW